MAIGKAQSNSKAHSQNILFAQRIYGDASATAPIPVDKNNTGNAATIDSRMGGCMSGYFPLRIASAAAPVIPGPMPSAMAASLAITILATFISS